MLAVLRTPWNGNMPNKEIHVTPSVCYSCALVDGKRVRYSSLARLFKAFDDMPDIDTLAKMVVGELDERSPAKVLATTDHQDSEGFPSWLLILDLVLPARGPVVC